MFNKYKTHFSKRVRKNINSSNKRENVNIESIKEQAYDSAVQHSIQQYNTPFSSTTLHISSTTLHISSTTLHISLLTDCNNPIRLGDRDTYPIQGTCYRGKPDISETVVMERLNQTGKKERFFKSLVNYHMI